MSSKNEKSQNGYDKVKSWFSQYFCWIFHMIEIVLIAKKGIDNPGGP